MIANTTMGIKNGLEISNLCQCIHKLKCVFRHVYSALTDALDAVLNYISTATTAVRVVPHPSLISMASRQVKRNTL